MLGNSSKLILVCGPGSAQLGKVGCAIDYTSDYSNHSVHELRGETAIHAVV